jgi:membrane protease YdiL (CAAX protease family)
MRKDRFSSAEFVVVILTAFGTFILTSLHVLLSGRAGEETGPLGFITSNQLYGIVIYELSIAPVVISILFLRGWRLADFPLGASRALTILGAGIAVLTVAGDWVFTVVLRSLFANIRSAMDAYESVVPLGGPSFASVVILSIVNPVYEEVFVCGYVIAALRERFGVTTAVNVSVLIRVLYHLYQGLDAFPFHAMYGLIQAYVFAHTGRLWPLIVSHAILDFYALVFLVR